MRDDLLISFNKIGDLKMADVEQIKIGEWIDREERAIASRLFKIRTKLGIDRDELATMAGLGITELVEYESGVQPIPASTLAMISAMMGVSIEYFYGDEAQIFNHSMPLIKEKVAEELLN
jgi:transcriptional regulator with XRE-family HTH domain